jgi:glycosyltransferase involved in cell wall biosynthesis
MTLSIISVTYNAAAVLERTIASVEAQQCHDFEYIIIDGASQDGTHTIINRHAASVSYYQSEPDNGIYYAMNKGLHAAAGDFVWFMNAGDTFFDKNTISAIVQLIKRCDAPPDVIYGETNIVDKHGNFLARRRLQAPETLTWKKFKMGMLVCHQSFIVRRKIAPDFDTQYRFSADFDWCIQCLTAARSIVNSRLILSNYLCEGATTANRMASLDERCRIMCRYYGAKSTLMRHLWFAMRFLFAKITRKIV